MTTRTVKAYEHKCHRCDHVWVGPLKKPKKCVKCQSPRWDTDPSPKMGNPKWKKGQKQEKAPAPVETIVVFRR